jgi:probable rRNA maturation factor
LKINLTNQQKDLSIDLHLVEKIVKTVLSDEKASCDELGIFFVDANRICQLHDEFFSDPSLTDCISFPIDIDTNLKETYRVLGDVFVCPYTAIEYATAVGKDPYHECTLYIVHGLLHLLGYDDIEDLDRLEMRKAEARLMKSLEGKNQLLKEEFQNLQLLN